MFQVFKIFKIHFYLSVKIMIIIKFIIKIICYQILIIFIKINIIKGFMINWTFFIKYSEIDSVFLIKIIMNFKFYSLYYFQVVRNCKFSFFKIIVLTLIKLILGFIYQVLLVLFINIMDYYYYFLLIIIFQAKQFNLHHFFTQIF